MTDRIQMPVREGQFDIIANNTNEEASFIDIEYLPKNEDGYYTDHARIRIEWEDNKKYPAVYIWGKPDMENFSAKIFLKNIVNKEHLTD